MSESWLQDWLEELNLTDYQELLIENGLISKGVLLHVEKSQLKDYGVTKPGHLNRLYKAIVKLRGDTHADGEGEGGDSNTSSSSDLISSSLSVDTKSVENQNSVIDSPPPPSPSTQPNFAPPPIPMRRSIKRRSPSPGCTMSVTDGGEGGEGDSNTSSSSDLISSSLSVDTKSMENQNSIIDSPPPPPSPSTQPNFAPPPIPMRRSIKRRSPSPGYTMSVTEGMLMSPQSRESSPFEEPPVRVPRRVHSLRKSPTPEIILPEVTMDPVASNASLGIDGLTSPVSEAIPDNPLGSPTNSPKRYYENVGSSAAGVIKQKPPPQPPPRVSSLDSDDSPPPIIPPQRSSSQQSEPKKPQAPVVSSYGDILEGEVWSEPSSSSAMYEPILEITGSQPPQVNNIDSNVYEPITDLQLPPPISSGDDLYEAISPAMDNSITADSAGGTVSGSDSTYEALLPVVDPSLDNFHQSLMSTDTSTSVPPQTGPPHLLGPSEGAVATGETPPPVLPSKLSVPDFIPPLPPSPKPPVPTRISSLPVNAESIDFESPPDIPPPPVSSLSPVSSPSLISSPPPFSPPPPTVIEDDSISGPIPPPIPKRQSFNLPPPPPPPITTEDYPEDDLLMLDTTGSELEYSNRGSFSGSGSDEQKSGSCTPGSPLTPVSSFIRIIPQLESGSDSVIGITPPSSFPQNAANSDSDDGSLSPSLSSGSNTLKTVHRKSSLEPLNEDTLLPTTNGSYETISPPKPNPRSRPKSTLIDEKKNELFSSLDKFKTEPKEGLSMSYNAYLESPQHGTERVTEPSRRMLPQTQSVRMLAKDLEKQTHKQQVMMRSRTEPDVTDGQLTISPHRYRSSLLIDVPPTIEGWLHKKGGKKNERPYQKRWVVFDGEELKYFRNKGEKEIDARNNVKLSEMIDVKRVADPEQTNRFDLVVINRVFQFFSDNEDNAQLWVNVLHAAISKFNPHEDTESKKEGGNMNNPDKWGFLQKQGHGRFAAGFKQRYVALKESRFAYYENREDFVAGKPIHILDMRLANIRPDMTGKTCRFTITMPNQRSYVFQASSDMERNGWIEKVQEAILNALNLAPEKKEGKKGVRAADILARIQENPSNKTCADCMVLEPSWAIINRGIMVCIECSGVHRSMGVHISKVRSVELDVEIWTETLIQLFQNIGNQKSNHLWERHCQSTKLDSESPREIREMFIRSKYESRSWIPRTMGDSQEVLDKALCVAVASDDLLRTMELLILRADPCYSHPDIPDSQPNTPLDIAKANRQLLQVELLEQNGALLDTSPSSSPQVSTAFRKGYLLKTGSDRQGWKRRYCTVDGYHGLEYFRSETDPEILGSIKVDSMLGVSQCCEVEAGNKDKYCFEVVTPGRAYLFAAESDQDMLDWIDTVKQIIPKDSADKLGYDKVGYLTKRSPQNVGWKKRWFSLKGKKLTYFKNSKEEIASIDMKMVTGIKGPEPGSFESSCSFQVIIPERVYHLRADNPAEADSWVQALRQTQVSVPLSEQLLTSGSGIPILVHKCLQFVEANGLEVEGLYRKSGEKLKIRNLLQQFNQDPRAVMIDGSLYTVHDVTGTLKQFFQGLPDPLLTHHLYQAFLDAATMSDHETKMHQLQSLIEQLPAVNKETLKRLVNHLLKVAQNESSNKMSQSNLTSLFGPTLMTVDGDPVSVKDMQAQYACIEHMMSYYGWLFNAQGEDEKREEAMQAAMKKLQAAKAQHQQQLGGMDVSTTFLISVYVGSKDGEVCGMKATLTTTAAEVVEFVTSTKNLPPKNYCVHLVLGDAESERPLHSMEQVLSVQTGDSYLCLKQNMLADKIKDFDSYSGQCVMLHLQEKKRWKKYPCSVKNKYFIIYKDNKCQIELSKIPLFDADLFIGIERKNFDVKNPLPTKYPLCLLVRVKETSKFLCAESVEDRLLISAAVIFSKHPDGIQTPVMPVKTNPKFFDARNRGISLLHPSGPVTGHSTMPSPGHSIYTNYKPGAKTFIPKKTTGDDRLMKELTLKQKFTSPERENP